MKNRTIPMYPLFLLLTYLAVLIWSVIRPKGMMIWTLEAAPSIVAVVILIWTYRRFRLTNLTYTLIWIAAVYSLVGGHYTYEEVPIGEWLREPLGLERNHYDRVGHLLQGAMTAALVRELLMRLTPLPYGGWMFGLAIGMSLAFSATYEIIEFTVALIQGESSDAFLGMQGDQWDAQWDMVLELTGAVLSQLLFRRLQLRQVARLSAGNE